MSMTDLFGSDVDESEEEETVADGGISEGENVKEQSAESGGSEHSGQEEDNEDEEPEEEEPEEEEEEYEEEEEDGGEEEEKEEEKEKEEDSDDGSNENEEEQDADEMEGLEGGQESHVDMDEKEETEKVHVPAENHKNVSSLDLFGEEVSSEEEEEVGKEQEEPEEEKAEERNDDSYQRHYGSDEGEGQEEQKAEEETQIDVDIPYSKFSLGTEIAFVKLPNFLSVETKPFDPINYEDEIEEDEVLDEEGRARMKLRVENTIRWRSVKDEDGNEVKESNARVVKWSDSTMSLLLGGEVFDILKTKIDGEHNHLFVQQGTGLQAQAIFHDKLTFRPHSTNSQTHRKMTLSIADRVSKTGKIKILPVVGKDPESKKTELIKKEEEKLRAQLRRENQQRRMRERSHARGLTASYLEPDRYDDDEDLEQSLLEMKKQYKKGIAKGRLGDVYSDQESEEEGISGGLESDDDSGENSADKRAVNSEDDVSRPRKHSFEEGSTKKKRKVIHESDEDESD